MFSKAADVQQTVLHQMLAMLDVQTRSQHGESEAPHHVSLWACELAQGCKT